MSPETRTILITGCSAGGIGDAVALEYQRRGFKVIATARNTSKISAALKALPDVFVVQLDVTSQHSIDKALLKVSEITNGSLDILFNNAGSSLTFPALETAIEAAKSMFDLHAIGPLAVTQAFAPLLMRTGNACIVNNASIAGETNLPYQSIYGASKAATINLGETLRLELKPLGIRVVTVITGIIQTKLHDNEPRQEMSKNSFFKPIESWIEDRRTGKNRPPGMSVVKYAEQLAARIEGGTSGKIYIGPLTPLFVFLKWWMPTFIWDMFMMKAGPENANELIALRLKSIEQRSRSELVKY